MIIKSACVINNKSHRFFWSKHWLNSRTFQSSFTWSSEKVKRTEKETDKDERNRKKPRSQIQLPFSFLKTLTLYHNGLKLFFSSQVRSKITQWNDRQSLTTPPPTNKLLPFLSHSFTNTFSPRQHPSATNSMRMKWRIKFSLIYDSELSKQIFPTSHSQTKHFSAFEKNIPL